MKKPDGREQLIDWIERRKLSGREASREIGLHWAHLSQIVNGHRVPGLMVAVRIERAAGIPVEAWLATSVTKSAKRQTVGDAKANDGKALTQNV